MSGKLALDHARRIHLVGVGGAGMSGIARVLVQLGHRVSGCDRQDSRALAALRALGAGIDVGHDESHLDDVDAVVTSSAVHPDLRELAVARERGLPVLHRSDMLAALMQGRLAVLVAGTHGKTTTTCMTVVALQAAGADPSFAIGGALNEAGANAHAGSGPLFVAEADESDRSFLAYAPDATVVTNVELDHLDVFADLADVADAFTRFLALRSAGAPAFVCADDRGALELARHADGDVVTYGESPTADVRVIVEGAQAAHLRSSGQDLVAYRTGAPGRHNLLNAAAALLVCRWAGADLERAAAGLATFTGAMRRFQRLGHVGGVEVVDDYAHHPSELRAVLVAARELAPSRVVLVVQPHRYSRTSVLGEDLGRAAAAADLVVVTDVYGAGEEPVPGVSGALVADAAARAGANVVWQPHLGDVAGEVVARVRAGDLVLVTGAGDVTQVGPAVLAALANRERGEGGTP